MPGDHKDLKFTLRRMKARDLEQVLEIECDSFQEPWAGKNFEREIVDFRGSIPTVAESGGVILGYTVTWRLRSHLHLANIAVRKSHRGKGVGRVLVLEVISRAKRAGAEKIMLEVRESNAEAIGLYNSLGFRPVAIKREYYKKEKEDAILMRLMVEDFVESAHEASGPGGTGDEGDPDAAEDPRDRDDTGGQGADLGGGDGR